MVISVNSQLGLRLNGLETQVQLLELLRDDNQYMLDYLNNILDKGVRNGDKIEVEAEDDDEANLIHNIFTHNRDTINKIKISIGEQNVIDGSNSSYYFICDSVYKAAELIKVNTGFTGRTLKDVNFGKYTYLMGKNKTVRFVCSLNAIMGFYFDSEKKVGFEFGVEMEEGRYYYTPRYQKEFTKIMQVLTFIELGDIEVKMLEAGRNNGGKKNVNKVTNTSNNTVYVVDSSWNQIIIRADGFAVRGHFRLQPCGSGMKDRTLIWIDAFEKHGYKRRPKAEIIN